MADHWRESDCNGSQLISCITAVICTLFITSSMCSVRFKIFKSVICQHYEVNAHTLTSGVQSVTLLSAFTWPRVHPKILPRPFAAPAGVFVAGICQSQRRREPLNPGTKLKRMWASEKRKTANESSCTATKKKARKAPIVSLVYITQWLPMVWLVLSLQVNRHSLLIRWHTLAHHACTSELGCFLASFAWRLHEDHTCVPAPTVPYCP